LVESKLKKKKRKLKLQKQRSLLPQQKD